MERKSRKIVQFISFVAVFLVGIIYLLDILVGVKIPTLINILIKIANGIMILVVLINAFFYVRTKRSNLFLALYLFGALLLISCYLIPFFI